MEQITVRKASLNDLDILLRFEQGVISSERPFDCTLKSEHTHYYDIEGMITASDVEIVVAESGGEIIGSGYARIVNSKPYLKHQKHAYLGFMYVDPNHRGKGVNGKIVEALKQWSVSQSVFEIRLEVYTRNLAAIKAYEKAGFIQHMVEMRIELKDE